MWIDLEFIFALIENLEKLIVLSAISQVINVIHNKNPMWGNLIRGVTFGLMGIFIMAFPYTLTSGITFDSRSVLISLTALFYSWQTSLIVTAFCLIYRLWMGGSGALMGSLVILSSFGLGMLWKTQPKINRWKGTWIEYYTLGLTVHLVMNALMVLLPQAVIESTLIHVGIPVLISYPLVMIVIGKLFSFQIIQNQQQDEIKRAEQQIRIIFDHAPIGIVYLTNTLKAISVNSVFTELTGYTKEDLQATPFSSLVYSEDPEEEKAIVRKITSGELDYFSADRQLITKDASKIWVTLTSSLVDPKPGTLIVTVQDIRQRKESEQLNEYLLNHDGLTGAFNPRYLNEKENEWKESGVTPRYLIVADVDNLRLINDAFGFKTGDLVLQSVAKTLLQSIRQQGKLIRFRSSEFVMTLFDAPDLDIERLLKGLRKDLNGLRIDQMEIGVSLGLFDRANQTGTFSEDLTQAEENMRKDKLFSMDRTVSNTIDVIMKSLFAKNSREMLHSQRVSSICVELCKALDLDKYSLEKVRIAGLMHDIGKIGIPESILDKPSSLTPEERLKMEEHAVIGFRILSSTSEFAEIAECILSHHERWDGTGYPRQLKQEQIPLFARIIALADTYDAMTSERPYRQPFTSYQALEELQHQRGHQFDPAVVDAFIRLSQNQRLP